MDFSPALSKDLRHARVLGRAFVWLGRLFLSHQVMGAISWMVDSLLYDEAIAVAEEEQREREREATQEEREQDKEDGVDDQVQQCCNVRMIALLTSPVRPLTCK